MTIGASGTFSVNNVVIITRPTSAQWKERDNMGYDGNAHPIYPATRNMELKWGLLAADEYAQLYNAYLSSTTGTLSWDLPQYGAATYIYKTYSGTTLEEPTGGDHFMNYIQDVTLLILNVRT
jgi:hypothetical protein